MFQSDPLSPIWGEHPWYWMDSSPFKTHFLNALSITLPGCERFFIDTIKAQSIVPELKDSVREFVKQESRHQAVHRDYNDWLAANGLPVDVALGETEQGWAVARYLGPGWRLALTVCIEHVTVVCTGVLLEHTELLDQMDTQFRQIWQWHAVEELEHRSVTMDVWDSIYSSRWRLWVAMLVTLPIYIWFVGRNTVRFLAADKCLWRWQNVRDGWAFLFGRSGIISGSWSKWMDIFRPGFHPDSHPVPTTVTKL